MEKNKVEIMLVEDNSDDATLTSLAFEKNESIAPIKIHLAKGPMVKEQKSTKHGFFRKKTENIVTPERSLSSHQISTSRVSEPSPPDLSGKHQNVKDQLSLDEDLCKALLITDNLRTKLPNYIIEVFAQSEDFLLYEKMLNRYRSK